MKFDVCIIGSGAGGSPIAYELAKDGRKVLVLEKGPWLKEEDYSKDELAAARRPTYHSDLTEEPHVLETETPNGWSSNKTMNTNMNFWNGNCVGGSSNFMSGFFYRLKPTDFKLRSTYGPIEGANIVDWPISYDEMEPYYTKAESLIGISGEYQRHQNSEPRSKTAFPYPPLAVHPVAGLIDKACTGLGFKSLVTPRAILNGTKNGRASCSYSGYCGGYGCATGAKGSGRAALLDQAVATGNCEVWPESMVSRIVSDESGQVASVEYFDKDGVQKSIGAKIYVVACQSIETARLLLMSKGPKHPNGLANGSGQIGKNLLFAGGGSGSGVLKFKNFDSKTEEDLRTFRTFINRGLQDWYVIKNDDGTPDEKGGTVDFTFSSSSPIGKANRSIHGQGGLVWGERLKKRLESSFKDGIEIKIEAFCDWIPNDDCFVELDENTKDKWGLPVAKVRINSHPQNLAVGWYLASKGAEVLKAMGAVEVVSFASSSPPTNLQAGTCRFGDDPNNSVLDKNCKAHEVENLYVTDGSFHPNGGSVPYTWTIYANSFRVADQIKKRLV